MPKTSVSISLLKKVRLLLLLLIVSFAIFVYESIKENQLAALINYSGKVRGNIQRLVKFYFAEKYEKIPQIEKEIDLYIKHVEEYLEDLKIPVLDSGKNFAPIEVEKCYKTLKELLTKRATFEIKEKVLTLSEYCWKKSDEITNFYQKMAERNFIIINTFYFLLFLVSILISLLLAKSIFFDINRKLEVRANFDPLTGAFNRGAFLEIYNNLSKSPFSYPMGLIVFDLDNFKQINDNYGHTVGDIVLREVAETVKKILRRSDIFVRWGGEEFVIVLPYTDLKGAIKVAEKLRKAIENMRFNIEGLKVTASFGVTEIKQDEDFLKAFDRADKALYEAKRKGKNKVEIA